MENELLQRLKMGETLVFGHRGASAYAPENTVPAFELAYEQGAAGVELDVVLSADNYPIVIHNFLLDDTTSGRGLVKEFTLKQLKELDAGAWKGEEYSGIQIPTLGEVFEAVGQKLYINIEIKSDTDIVQQGVEEIVASNIRIHNLSQRVLVSSFNPFVLQRFRDIMPEVPIGFLTFPDMPDALLSVLNDPDTIHPYHEMIDADYMAEAQRRKQIVNAWTVNDAQRSRKLKAVGVGIIMTDYPDLIIDALAG